MYYSFVKAVAVAALLTTSPASALIIDLETETAYSGPVYTNSGFKIYNTYDSTRPPGNYNSKLSFLNWTRNGAGQYNANGKNATIATNYEYMTIVISSLDDSPFSFNGISLADVYNSPIGGIVDFVFRYADGSTRSDSVTLKEVQGLQRYSFNENNISNVSFTGRTKRQTLLQFDFIEIGGELMPSVPEPSTWALMILGFGAVGYSTRRRNRIVMRSQIV